MMAGTYLRKGETMRIIAENKTDTGYGQRKLILEATEQEIARLVGFYFHGDKDCPQLIPGLDIKVNEMYDKLHLLKTNSIKETSKTLQKILDALSELEPITDVFK